VARQRRQITSGCLIPTTLAAPTSTIHPAADAVLTAHHEAAEERHLSEVVVVSHLEEPMSLLAPPSAHHLRLVTIPTNLSILTRSFVLLRTRALSEAAEDVSYGNRTRHSAKSVIDDAGNQAATY
jgi:hypothetical protein